VVGAVTRAGAVLESARLMASLCAVGAVPEVAVTVLAHDAVCADAVLVPDAARAPKVVRGARTAGGERTWLRVRYGQAPPLVPHHARLRVVCCGLAVEFALHAGALTR
jgi:hypothetical protein